MRKLFLLLLLGFVVFKGICQPEIKTIDSLKNALSKYVKVDSNRLNMLMALSKITGENDEDLKIVDEAISLAKTLNIQSKLGDAYYYKASNLLELGKDTLALTNLNYALKIYKELKIAKREAAINMGYARVFQSRGEYNRAIEYDQIAVKYFETIDDLKMLGQLNLDIGICYRAISDYVNANKYYIISKNYYEKKGEPKSVAMTYSNLAQIEKDLKKHNSAIEFYRKALAVQYTINDSLGIARSYQGIGITYDAQTKSDSALLYYNKALAINKRNGYKVDNAENLANLGITYKDINRFTESYFALNEAIKLFDKLNRTRSKYQVEVNIGELFCNAPDSFFTKRTIPIAQRYIKAGALFNGIIEYAKESEDLELESLGWEGLSSVYEKKGDYKNAFDAYKKNVVIRDSIVNEEKITETTNQLNKNEFERKEAISKATHNAEIKQQKIVKNSIAAGASIIALGGIISFVFYKRKRDAVSKQQEAELKSEISDTEMKALRAQMNPHFIFNSLNSIGDYIAKNNTKLADEYLAKFAKLMRLILENSEKKEVPLTDDLKALELYMQLEALRMNQKFTYQIKVDDDIDIENTLVPPLLLQPFVENSIWHGISNKDGVGKILVHIKKEGEMINCVVEDDGIGRKQAAEKSEITQSKKSLGMKITKARIDILNKVKNATAAVQLFDLAQGTRVEVKLPLALSF
jgi:tetratricopeptide (TPR) repeat protein/putative ubiquitin-RnfH superfamily antitoxin RatB of RatAB toxin-antitoxin module